MCCPDHWIGGNGGQWTRPLGSGGFKPAQAARADCQLECSRSRYLSLCDHNLLGEALQYLPHWIHRLQAVRIGTQRKPLDGDIHGINSQPGSYQRGALSENCPSGLEQEQTEKMDDKLGNGIRMDQLCFVQPLRGIPDDQSGEWSVATPTCSGRMKSTR